MIRSTIASSVKKVRHYYKMNAIELRHVAGLAWAAGQKELASFLEALAVAKGDKWKSGQHRSKNIPRGSSYFKGEHRLTFSSRRMGAA